MQLRKLLFAGINYYSACNACWRTILYIRLIWKSYGFKLLLLWLCLESCEKMMTKTSRNPELLKEEYMLARHDSVTQHATENYLNFCCSCWKHLIQCVHTMYSNRETKMVSNCFYFQKCESKQKGTVQNATEIKRHRWFKWIVGRQNPTDSKWNVVDRLTGIRRQRRKRAVV